MKITKKLLTKIIKEELEREMSEKPKRQSLYRARRPFPKGFNNALLEMYKYARRGQYDEGDYKKALEQLKQIEDVGVKVKAVAYLMVMKLLCESGKISLRDARGIEQSGEQLMLNAEEFLSKLFTELDFQVNDAAIGAELEDAEKYMYKIWEDMLAEVDLVDKAKLYDADEAVLYAKPRELAKEFPNLIKDYEAKAGPEQTSREIDASEYAVS